MNIRKTASSLLMAGALGVGGIAAAEMAVAQPPGCSGNSTSFSASSTGLLKSSTSSTCSGSATRTIVAEIKWDKAFSPDPLVAKNSLMKTGTSYAVSTSSCDGGNTRGYYARGYFTTYTTYYDSGAHSVRSC